MSARYRRFLDRDRAVVLAVEFTTVGPDVSDYVVVLLAIIGSSIETVRVYDGAHGINEMHRYTRAEGKQAAREFHGGTLSEGMNAAIDNIKAGYAAMIDGWEGKG